MSDKTLTYMKDGALVVPWEIERTGADYQSAYAR
jgi:hypothetical protein